MPLCFEAHASYTPLNVSSTSNVGIGTTTPQSALSVLSGNVGINTWSADGGNLIVRGGGNVGIGSAWPGAELDVSGTVRATAFVGSGAGLTGVAAGGWTDGGSTIYTSTGSDNLGIGTSTPQGAGLVVTNGNVGIGTWAPPVALNVRLGNVGIGTISTSQSKLEIQGDGGSEMFRLSDSGANDMSPFIVNSDGNVGIGTTRIPLPFFMTGPSRINSALIATSDIASVVNPWVTFEHSIHINYTSPYQALIRGADTKSAYTAAVLGTTTGKHYYGFLSTRTRDTTALNFTSVSEGDYLPAIGFGGMTSTYNTIGASIQGIVDGAVGGNTLPTSMVFHTTTTNSTAFVEQMRITSAGNIGIGTITPTSRFVVAGGGIGIGTNSNSTFIRSATPLGGLAVEGNIGIATTSPQAKLAVLSGNVGINTWTADGGGLIVLGGANVGIGSAWPGAELDVSGTVRATAFVGNGAGLTGISGGSSQWATSAGIGIGTYDAVGIGTTSPQASLVVTSGNVGIGTWVADVALRIREGNIGIGTASATSKAMLEISGNGAKEMLRINNDGPNDTSPIVIDRTGAIGINTVSASANYFVHINSSLNTDARDFIYASANRGLEYEIRMENTNTGPVSYVSRVADNDFKLTLTYVGSGNGRVGFFGEDVEKMSFITSSGNFGISTTTPQAKFIVTNGNVGIGTWIADGGNLIVRGGGNVGIATAWPGATLDISSPDNTTAQRIIINATSANVTAADTFISFDSTDGQIGNIVGTAGAGTIAYNTFTGSHWTSIVGKDQPNELDLLCSTGDPLKGFSQLTMSRICDTFADPSVIGAWGGRDKEGHDLILSIGTGEMKVANKGVDIALGDYLVSSDVKGFAEKQSDNIYRNYTVARAMEKISWKDNEKYRRIKVIYQGG